MNSIRRNTLKLLFFFLKINEQNVQTSTKLTKFSEPSISVWPNALGKTRFSVLLSVYACVCNLKCYVLTMRIFSSYKMLRLNCLTTEVQNSRKKRNIYK